MKNRKRLLVSILCALALVFCLAGLVACGNQNKNTECSHNWGEWTVTTPASCTDEGVKEHKCSKCNKTESASIDALNHDWQTATCLAPKKCSRCSVTEGVALSHSYTKETVKAEALKTSATCTNAAVYYKSCATCGEISANMADTFTSGNPLPHTYTESIVKATALKSAATCTSAAVYYKSCATCGIADTNVSNTFTSGTTTAHHFTQSTVKTEALKSAATCTSAAVYYKSCADCGTVSTSNTDIFTSGNPSAHAFTQSVVKAAALKSAATCTDAAIYYKSCVDCGTVSTNDGDTFANGVATGHNYVEYSSEAATCNFAQTITYICHCGDQYTDVIGDALGHDISSVTPAENLVAGCEYVLVYRCSRAGCGEDVDGDTVYHHNYVAKITKAATCETAGVKTLTCSKCQENKTEEIAKDTTTGHNWIKGVASEGLRTDTCGYCHNTKSVTVFTGNATNATNANNFKNTEIELNGTNISMDDGVIDALDGQDVTLGADKLLDDDRKDVGLTQEDLDRIGDSPIYNFTINNGEISQFGDNWVTITLPYELSDGEDVDSIAIWFINDYGEVESIKATYNNGFVTFKTNHFSYYTVTKLTPAERCNLYGHSYVTQHVAATCTKDGYDLLVCVRCTETHKENEVKAKGHDYAEDIHAATCTVNGYITYSCKNCTYSYTKKLNATGHSWTVTDSAQATCTANGFTKHECSDCDAEYTEISDKLNHTYTHTQVPATCDSNGYTSHECSVCGHSYEDAYVAALGHEYSEPDWTWAADYSSATLTLTCQNDATHTLVLDASIGKSVVNGACSEFEKTTYTASVAYNGKVYTDVKVVEIGTPDHKFSANWSYDDTKHWHECICGEKSDIANHVYANETVTKQPTCVESGESTSYCECGATKKTVIPATGEHDYKNGVCTVCGRDESACDHTELHEVTINPADYGVCETNVLVYYTCECGEVKMLDTERSYIGCDFMHDAETDEYEDENGNVVRTMHGVCSVCGMEMSAIGILSEDGCTVTNSVSYTFKIDGKVIAENVTYEIRQTLHSYVLYTIDLDEYGACGGYVTVSKCENCGEVEYIYDYELDCDVDLEKVPDFEEVMGEDGFVHYVFKEECPDCDIVFFGEMWTEEISACVTIAHQRVAIYYGDTVIAEMSQEYYSEAHEYEYTYEMLGETCEDGVRVTVYCPICGERNSYTNYGHHYVNFELDLSEYGGCGGRIVGRRCSTCNIITQVFEMSIRCNIENLGEFEEVVIDGVTHYIAKVTCPDCGLVFASESWSVEISECEHSAYQSQSIYSGEELIFEYLESYHSLSHRYEYTYEPLGETCEDGYYVIVHCTVCGQSERYKEWGHRFDKRQTSLEEFGLCGGYVYEEYCGVCGVVFNSNIDDWACEWEHRGINEEGYEILECRNCGAVKTMLAYDGEKNERCEFIHTEAVVYTLNGKEVYRYESSHISVMHDFEYRVELHGESCTDGYTVIYTCKDCGEIHEESGNRHNRYTVLMYENHGHTVEIVVCPCGLYHEAWINGYTLNYENDLDFTCDECGFSISFKKNQIEEGCTRTETTVISVKSYDEVLFFEVWESVYANHSFSEVSVSMEDGRMMISVVCDKCDEVISTEFMQGMVEEHYFEYNDGKYEGGYDGNYGGYTEYYYEFTFTPEVSGKYTILGLADIDTLVRLYKVEGGNLTEIDSNAYGGDYGQFRLTSYLTAGETYIYRLSFMDRYREGEIDFAFTQGSSDNVECTHPYVREFVTLLEGSESCEDGFYHGRMCISCGMILSLRTEYMHISVLEEVINLSDYGACDGMIRSYSCACGKVGGVEYDFKHDNRTANEYYDDEGRLIYVEVFTCSECGLRFTNSYYTVKNHENCTLTYYYTIVVNVGATLVLNKQFYEVRTDHEYETVATLERGEGSSCEDGVIITRRCIDCGTEYSSLYYYHYTYDKEVVELGKYGSVCGGYAVYSGCACGEKNDLYLDHSLCHFDEEWCELWIANAIKDGYQQNINGYNYYNYYSYVYLCSVTDPACAFAIRYAQYWKKDGNSCIAYQYRTWQFGYNEKTGACAYELTLKTGSKAIYHNYSYVEKQNGYEYNCRDCGSYYHVSNTYDANGMIKNELTVLNNVEGYDKYHQIIEEYTYDAFGNSYINTTEKWIYADGSESETTGKQTPLKDLPFGDWGVEGVFTSSHTNGNSSSRQYAKVYYRGQEFFLYDYIFEGDYWYKFDYSYSFEDGCVQTITFSSSYGENWEEINDICRFWDQMTIKAPTCTQDGIEARMCVVCGKIEEDVIIAPHGHNWVEIREGWHYCFECGLENANGASGEIIMEDLTEKYGEGVNYVVGYYAKNDVQFLQYVSLVFGDDSEKILEGVEFTEIEGLRAVVFSKAQVEALAQAAGYTDSSAYNVRFTFVPFGSDGSFDYAITFAETTAIGTIINSVAFTNYVGSNEKVTFTITPEEDGEWIFTTRSWAWAHVTLVSENDEWYLDYYGNDRTNYCRLEAGKAYTFTVEWDDVNYAGYMIFIFTFTPDSAK